MFVMLPQCLPRATQAPLIPFCVKARPRAFLEASLTGFQKRPLAKAVAMATTAGLSKTPCGPVALALHLVTTVLAGEQPATSKKSRSEIRLRVKGVVALPIVLRLAAAASFSV